MAHSDLALFSAPNFVDHVAKLWRESWNQHNQLYRTPFIWTFERFAALRFNRMVVRHFSLEEIREMNWAAKKLVAYPFLGSVILTLHYNRVAMLQGVKGVRPRFTVTANGIIFGAVGGFLWALDSMPAYMKAFVFEMLPKIRDEYLANKREILHSDSWRTTRDYTAWRREHDEKSPKAPPPRPPAPWRSLDSYPSLHATLPAKSSFDHRLPQEIPQASSS